MSETPSTLIIPVENQVREFDAKLLLACFAAERGYPVILGSRTYCHFEAASMPRGVYMAKSMRSMSDLMFRILRMLGDEIVCWEEEGLVHPPPEIFFGLRLSPTTVKMLSHMFAWGQENRDVIMQYPHFPDNLPIHVTGNPRGDMLRSEIRGYFDDEVKKLRDAHGRFILINTNFSDVNPFIPAVGLFLESGKNGEKPKFGQAGKGMTFEFAEGLRDHKQRLFDEFVRIIPILQRTFSDRTIVIRPHPSEKKDIYNQLAAESKQLVVTNEGNVIPWLLASGVMVHNGCTTGMEAYCLQVPAVSYLADFNEYYDYDFQGMPTKLSHQCFSLQELTDTLTDILNSRLGAAQGEERKELISYYLAAREGPFACEQILDVLDSAGYGRQRPAQPPLPSFAMGLIYAKTKAWLTKLYMHRPGPNRRAYHDHRFPELGVADVERRIRRFSSILNRFDNIRVKVHSRHLFDIDTSATG